MSIIPNRSTTPYTPAVLAVAHPRWCATSECRPTPDSGTDGTGFVNHAAPLLDADGLLVLVIQGETVSPQGDVLEVDPIVILCEGTGGARELTAEQAHPLADALFRAAAVAGGAR